MKATLKHPSAWIPLTMSLAGVTLVLAHFAAYGAVHEADEGTAAHIFQLLMAGQVPIVVWFVCRWAPRVPLDAFGVLALQAAAAIAAFACVYFLT